MPLPVERPRPAELACLFELCDPNRQLAAVHPILLNEAPELLAVHLGLAFVSLAATAVGALEPLDEGALPDRVVQRPPECRAQCLDAGRVGPAKPEPQLRLSEEEPCFELSTKRLVHETADEAGQQRLVVSPTGTRFTSVHASTAVDLYASCR